MSKKLLYLVPVALLLALMLGNTASAELIAHWPLDGDFADVSNTDINAVLEWTGDMMG